MELEINPVWLGGLVVLTLATLLYLRHCWRVGREFDALLVAVIEALGHPDTLTIRQAMEARLGRFVSYGELYLALCDLEARGVLRSCVRVGERPRLHYWRA